MSAVTIHSDFTAQKSQCVIAFLPRSNCLLNSSLQSPSTVILKPEKRKSITSSTFSPICHAVMGSEEKAMATHSSTRAWKIPWMEEPGGLQSTGSLRVRHDWATSLSLFTLTHWRRWQSTPVFLPGESQGQGAWWAAVYGVPRSRTRLKWISSSSSSIFFFSLFSL